MLRNHTERAHALLSPSSAYRWIHCPASARLEENFPNRESDFAKEGTLAHEICESKLNYRLAIDAGKDVVFTEEYKNNVLYQSEMDGFTDAYVNIVWDSYHALKQKDATTKLIVECRLDLSSFVPESFGSADAVILSDEIIHVFDFKYGKGVEVSAFDNPQMKLYALGASSKHANLTSNLHVEMTIVQPRLYNTSHYKIRFVDLLIWAKTILKPAGERAFSGGVGEQHSGDWCKFCRAKGRCSELKRLSEEKHKTPGLMTASEMAEALTNLPLLKSYIDALEVSSKEMIEAGNDIPGWKLVEGKSRRKITDEKGLEKELLKYGFAKNVITKTELRGITELEKCLGKSLFCELSENYISKVSGNPELVKDSDKRPALSQVQIDYKEIEKDNL